MRSIHHSKRIPENKEDWPFFWGENEVTVGGCANYIFLAATAQLATGK
jgi:endoglucanase